MATRVCEILSPIKPFGYHIPDATLEFRFWGESLKEQLKRTE